jgi:hypothetical protein
MVKRLIIILILMACPAFLHAQQLTVSATVTGSNGPWANGTAHASLVCPGNAQAYSGTFPIARDTPTVALDGNGHFSQVLFDTSQLKDVNGSAMTTCSYVFRITEACGISNFSTGALTGITGAGPVDLTSQINTFTVPLSAGCAVPAGTVTSITATAPIVVTPTPLTGIGVVSCPTCAAGGTISITATAPIVITPSPTTGTGVISLSITPTTCTNQVISAISASGVGTCHTVAGADMANNTVTATQLATQYSKLRCDTGLGDGLNAVAAGTYLQTNCYNDSGVTWTITRIGCFTDNGGSSTLNATNGAATGLLTGAVTCTAAAGGAAGTQSATTTIASGDVIKFTWVADGTSKQTEWFISLTQ